MNSSGDGPDYDQWDGYPAERGMIYSYLHNRSGSFVMLSGAIHGSMAMDIRIDPLQPGGRAHRRGVRETPASRHKTSTAG